MMPGKPILRCPSANRPLLVDAAQELEAGRDVPAPPSTTRFTPAMVLPDERTDVVFGDFVTLGRPRWRTEALADLGMGTDLLETLSELDGHADLKWIEGIVRAAKPVCGRVAEQSSMIVSGGHSELAQVLGLPIQRPGDLPPYGGSIYCVVESQSSADLEWLRRVQGDRGLHVIIHDETSDAFIDERVTAVSYSSELGAAIALKWAMAKDIGLVFGVTQDGSPIRASAFDVALAIRKLDAEDLNDGQCSAARCCDRRRWWSCCPIAYLMAAGELTASDAGTRAVATLIGVLAVRRVVGYLGLAGNRHHSRARPWNSPVSPLDGGPGPATES